MNKTIIMIALICAFTAIVSPAFAKRGAPKYITPVSKDGIEYSAPLDPSQLGFVVASWQKTKGVIWRKQIYVIKYEYKYGLEEDIQWVFVSGIRLTDNKLIITNEVDYEYELDLDSLQVKVLKGTGVIDNTIRKSLSH